MPRTEQSGAVVLLAYHSINQYREDRIRVPGIVSPGAFEAQIRYLVDTYRVIALPDYLGHMKEGMPLPGRSAVVTFDDGYKDNLTIAAPILRKYGVSATFFVVTSCIGAGKMKWEDELSCLIRRSKAEGLLLNLPGGQAFSLSIDSGARRLAAIDALVNVLGHLAPVERLRILDELKEQTKAKCDGADVMMTWDDVRRLAETPGFSVGSHSVTHQHLQRIPSDEVMFEVSESKAQLEHEIGCPVTLLAYPYGGFDRAVVADVQAAGYRGAVTLEYGENSIRSDPFRLKRVLAPNRTGVRFSAGMRLRTSVFGEFLRRSYNAFGGLRRTALMKKIRTRPGSSVPCGS